MIIFENGIDARCREPQAPTVAKITFKAQPWREDSAVETRYCVIGTNYGYLHTTGGDVRTWRSYSGARRAAKNYAGL
jgi:TctA family transporter